MQESGGDRGNRGHPGFVRSHRRPYHRQSGRQLPGQDDRPGGGGGAAQNPDEIALHILLVGLTIVFLIACVTLVPGGLFRITLSTTVIAALLVCLIPTTIGGLLSAIGIAGMDRLIRKNVLAMSGRAVEAAGDVDSLLLDKTGTITLGNRMASELLPAPGVTVMDQPRPRGFPVSRMKLPRAVPSWSLSKRTMRLPIRRCTSLGPNLFPSAPTPA